MRLSEMRHLLAARNLQLTRSLGQNFLHDANQLRRIVDLAEIRRGERVLEIGPGLGPLTEHLLAAGADVLAIEKDARLVAVLAERLGVALCTTLPDVAPTPAAGEPGRLRLVQADALRVLEDQPWDWSAWKLVANLPYSVASPILVELASAERAPALLVVTLQLEVVRRLQAGPGSKDYGVLTLLVQMRYEPRGSFRIPADCFFPAPDVESACIALARRPAGALTAAGERVFRQVVRRAFSERRKKALKLLKFDWPAPVLEVAWSDLGLKPDERAENLTRDHFLELARRLTNLPAHERRTL